MSSNGVEPGTEITSVAFASRKESVTTEATASVLVSDNVTIPEEPTFKQDGACYSFAGTPTTQSKTPISNIDGTTTVSPVSFDNGNGEQTIQGAISNPSLVTSDETSVEIPTSTFVANTTSTIEQNDNISTDMSVPSIVTADNQNVAADASTVVEYIYHENRTMTTGQFNVSMESATKASDIETLISPKITDTSTSDIRYNTNFSTQRAATNTISSVLLYHSLTPPP